MRLTKEQRAKLPKPKDRERCLHCDRPLPLDTRMRIESKVEPTDTVLGEAVYREIRGVKEIRPVVWTGMYIGYGYHTNGQGLRNPYFCRLTCAASFALAAARAGYRMVKK